jgi:hypothetical protein
LLEQTMMKRAETFFFLAATTAALMLAAILGAHQLTPREPVAALPVVKMERIIITAERVGTPEQLALAQ